jgi:hypothetical protein
VPHPQDVCLDGADRGRRTFINLLGFIVGSETEESVHRLVQLFVSDVRSVRLEPVTVTVGGKDERVRCVLYTTVLDLVANKKCHALSGHNSYFPCGLCEQRCVLILLRSPSRLVAFLPVLTTRSLSLSFSLSLSLSLFLSSLFAALFRW